MFTGIIETIGTVRSASKRNDGLRLAVDAGVVAEGAKPGDSVSVNGACLTAAAIAGDTIEFDVVPETAERTGLRLLAPGHKVNLERPLRVGDRLSGHIVQGHVDGTGSVRDVRRRGESVEMEVAADRDLLRYVVVKGSIAVDGVSLTVAGVGDDGFQVALIPTTLAQTTLGLRKPGDQVNLETDILAKYVERISTARASEGLTEELLSQAGFA